eukprot:m.113076 g.113076  ORF g.113076 m.113076 type:complete len:55 (+) comp17058_c1_seq2:146-310(+)
MCFFSGSLDWPLTDEVVHRSTDPIQRLWCTNVYTAFVELASSCVTRTAMLFCDA